MTIKVKTNEVILLYGKSVERLQAVYKQLSPLFQQSQLQFLEPQVGSGYIQWSAPGDGWTRFTEGSADEQGEVADVYEQRKAQVLSALAATPVKDIVFSVPSNDFILFRKNGASWDIALAAWAYRYPGIPYGGDLKTFAKPKAELQQVNIGYQWAGKLLPNIGFTLNERLPRRTGADGLFRFDGLVPVGEKYTVALEHGEAYTLIVVKGQSDYIRDLTKYYRIDVDVRQDGVPAAGRTCQVSFHNKLETLVTDENGRAQLQLPLVPSASGEVLSPQPPCMVSCQTDVQQQTPQFSGDELHYQFDFVTPPPPEKQYADVEVTVVHDGKPQADCPCEVTFNGETFQLTTNSAGNATLKLELAADANGNTLPRQPQCVVKCKNEEQRKTPQGDADQLDFLFTSESEVVTPEPEYVYIELKDYGGFPMPDVSFTLTTKKKGRQQLVTDSQGRCRVPKEWFSPKEKMKVDFVLSPEYQTTHDLHDKKNPSKK